MSQPSLAAHLEEQILSGRLSPGAKLPSERQLAERFGVSRPMVRETLRGLVGRSLVEVQPGRGAYVRHARASDAAGRLDALFRRRQVTPRDMVEARLMLECTAAGLAAERAGSADIDALAAALAGLDRAGGLIEQTRADLIFHLTIAHAARNPVIDTMFGAITGLAVEMMLRSLADPDVARTALPYHRAIVDAIRDRDPAGARRAMTDHLAVAASLYGEDFDRNLETVARRELSRLLAPGVTLDDLIEAAVPVREGGGDWTAAEVAGGSAMSAAGDHV